MASLYFQCRIQGLDDDMLVVRNFEGCESLSDLGYLSLPCNGFHYDIGLASRRDNLSPEEITDKNATLSVYHDGELSFCVHGIIRAFEKRNSGYDHTFYRLTLVPALERLSLRHNSRIFQFKTPEDIIRTLLAEMGIDDVRFTLVHEYRQREYCVQYRETDLDFIHRLAAEEGMVYHFEHSEGKHTLVFTDAQQLLPKLKETVLYEPLGGGVAYRPFISEFNIRTQSAVTRTQLSDYSFKKPAYHLTHKRNTQHQTAPGDYPHFDAPGGFQNVRQGEQLTRVRQGYLERETVVATGNSNDPALRAGFRFEIEDDVNRVEKKQWYAIAVMHKGEQSQALEESAGSGATTYSNSVSAVPASINWQATPNLKPCIQGPLSAVVTGPENEEIHTDEYGRVKVHFHWDRYTDFDDKSSCWLRVSQISAGNQYGMMALPRVGSEVLVSFLNSDPDRPVITGQLYNAANTPPYPLPQNKTRTTLRSKTHHGDGFNELSFEDRLDSEQVYLRAQRDLHQEVLHDQYQNIANDRHETIGNHHKTQVEKSHQLNVFGESRHSAKGAISIIAGESLQQKSDTLAVIDAGNEIHLKSGKKIIIEAGAELTLKAGGSFIKLDAAGVHSVGPAINQNSGGSAGNGSGFSGKAAELPLRFENGKLILPTETTALSMPSTQTPLVTSPLESLLVANQNKAYAVNVCLKQEGQTHCSICAKKGESS